MAILAQYLFGTSAFLYGVSILGHARFGFQTTYPALKTIPSTHEHTLGKTSARVSYDFANATLAIAGEFCMSLTQGETGCSSLSALLNWQWSRTLGPVSVEERFMMWALVMGCGVGTWRYTQAGMYGPLICTFVAPVCSLVGWWLS